jgi:hypothetical protein
VSKPVIVLEFNELCPTLMDRFIEQGRLPNFARLRSQSKVFITDAEEQAPNLEPWIQWITVHTGLGFEEHGVFNLDDGAALNAPRLWDLVSQAGGNVFVCGSMNPGYLPGLRGSVLPDPWSTKAIPYPAGTYDTYLNYVRKNVQEHTRDKSPVTKGEHLRFLSFMLSHGLSWSTCRRIVSQLLSERGGKSRWKRATILDRLQWDLFHHQWQRERPALSTFFLNSTAHFQHSYWRNMDPTPFTLKPTGEEQSEYANAVLFGYQEMDVLVGNCLALAGKEATVVLCTALSQQPCLVWEDSGGKVIHRPQDTDQLLRWAGVTGEWHHAPVMAEQFHLYFPNEEAAAKAARILESIQMNGTRVMMARLDGKSIFAGSQIFHKAAPEDRMTSGENGAAARFLQFFYPIAGIKSGMHHPDGIFWVSQPGQKPSLDPRKIPLRQVTSTLLGLMDVPAPSRVKPVPAAVSQA